MALVGLSGLAGLHGGSVLNCHCEWEGSMGLCMGALVVICVSSTCPLALCPAREQQPPSKQGVMALATVNISCQRDLESWRRQTSRRV